MVIRGINKGDCVHKMHQKYGLSATILREKEIHTSGPFGLFPRKWVEIEFFLSPQRRDALLTGEPAISGSHGAGGSFGTKSSHQKTNSGNPAGGRQARDDTTLDFVEAKKRVLAAAGKNPDQVIKQVQDHEEKENAQQLILDQLKEIREKMDTVKKPKEDHSALIRITQMLKKNEFSESYISSLMERARKEMPLEILEDFNSVQDRFLEWIGESINIYTVPEKPENFIYTDRFDDSKHRRVMVLIGPTGVGKTTTVAKLAAIYGLGNSGRQPLSVRIITIDAFRIGAREQIRKFGDIMDIPVSYIDNSKDLRKELDIYGEETDLILIDTIGRSPKDSAKLGEMKELLDACGAKAEIHLVFTASTKTGDIKNIMRQFEHFGYKAVVLTKFDETGHVGNVISALAESGKPVSFVTDGQDVPKYIKKASVVWFLTNLEEFRVDREKIENRFPVGEADQFQWS